MVQETIKEALMLDLLGKLARKKFGVKDEAPQDEYMRLELEMEELAIANGMNLMEMLKIFDSELRSILGPEKYKELVSKYCRMADLWGLLSEEAQDYHKSCETKFGWMV